MSGQAREVKQVSTMLSIAGQVEAAVEAGHPADRELARIYRRNKGFGSHDRRFYSDAVFSLFRWRGWTGRLTAEGPQAVLMSMLLDARELPCCSSVLAEMASADKSLLRALGHLDLGAKAESLVEMGAVTEMPDYRALTPEWVWNRLSFDSEREQRLWARSLQHSLPVWIRVSENRMRDAEELLRSQKIPFEHHFAVRNALSLRSNISRALLSRPEASCLSIQDLASQCVGIVCAPTNGQRWWDACAGSGGKTLHLADLMGNRGAIFATDSRSRTLRRLLQRLRRSNVDIVKVARIDATMSHLSEDPFDGVLVDAPCSGSGTWSRNPDARWRTDPEDAVKLANVQKQLLDNAVPAVKHNGRLVYAVCSVLARETTDVVESFLRDHPAFSLEPFKDPLSGSETNGMLLVRPWQEPAIGMFVARFLRG